MTDDELRELFDEMREEGVPGESLARVRRAVGAAVEARRRTFGMWWRVATLLAVAGCVVVVLRETRTVTGPAPVPAVQAPVVAVEEPPSAPVAAPIVHKPVRAATKPVRELQKAPVVDKGASEIRIESPYEPDVVILLIGG